MCKCIGSPGPPSCPPLIYILQKYYIYQWTGVTSATVMWHLLLRYDICYCHVTSATMTSDIFLPGVIHIRWLLALLSRLLAHDNMQVKRFAVLYVLNLDYHQHRVFLSHQPLAVSCFLQISIYYWTKVLSSWAKVLELLLNCISVLLILLYQWSKIVILQNYNLLFQVSWL